MVAYKMEQSGSSPQVFLIKVSRGAMKNNNYLVVDSTTREAVIVDPAWELEKIETALEDSHSRLNGILVTHSHPDHIDLAKPLSDRYGCPIWMSRPGVAASGLQAHHLAVIDETPWFVGNMRIEPILTPGHTPGCACYLIEDSLFTGDMLFAEGCGICMDFSSAYTMFESLMRLRSRITSNTRIFPGHTYVRPPGQRFGDLLGYNMYLNFPDKESFAAFRLREGQNFRRMFDFR